MRPLPPKYPLAYVVYCIIGIGLMAAIMFTLDEVWDSLDIQVGGFRIDTSLVIGVLLSVPIGLFLTDRFYKIACLRRIYAHIPLSVRQSRSATLYGDFQDIYARAVEVIEEFEPKDMSCDPKSGVITAHTKRIRWSWGERLRVVLAEEPEGWVSFEIHSRPILPTAYVDRGINAINVEHFIARMEKQFRTRTGKG